MATMFASKKYSFVLLIGIAIWLLTGSLFTSREPVLLDELLKSEDFKNIVKSYCKPKVRINPETLLGETKETTKKVLIFCYASGGSSFLSEVFRQNPQVSFWYEPYDAFYSNMYGTSEFTLPSDIFWYQQSPSNSSQRSLSNWELQSLVEFNNNLLSGNIHNLPLELFENKLQISRGKVSLLEKCLSQYYTQVPWPCRSQRTEIEKICSGNIAKSIKKKCHHNIQMAKHIVNTIYEEHEKYDNAQLFVDYIRCKNAFKTENIDQCSVDLTKDYNNSKLIAYKTTLLKMRSVEDMLLSDSDLKVIYLVRDPRAIAISRGSDKLIYRGAKNNPVSESKFLCEKMFQDYIVYTSLNIEFAGRIQLIKVEDLIMNRYQTEEIYRFLDMEVPPDVFDGMEMNKTLDNSAHPVNSTTINYIDSINKWKSSLNEKHYITMTKLCRKILGALKYSTIWSK